MSQDTLRGQRCVLPRPLVSILVPCFNQGRYLMDALRSILCQTYSHHEILVIDDGSTDDTREVAARFHKVKYFYQENRGLASARNAGIRESKGDLLVFLDADDLLSPSALQIGVGELMAHPECAFVSGDHRRVAADLTPLFKFRARPIERDHYLAFLRGNYIGMHATVMYRRKPIEEAGGFNESLAACEDYDLYLRIARQNPVRCHDNVVADYRQHDSNMSRDPEFMLKWALAVHHHQYDYVKGHADRELAYAEGDKYLREYYGNQVFRQLRARFQMSPADFRSIRSLGGLLLQYPILRVSKARMREKLGYLADTLRRVVRRSTVWPPLGKVRFRAMRSQRPICPTGCNLPSITRWYSEHWIEKWQAHLHGRVLRVCAADLRADSIESLAPEEYDAVVCPLQMQSVYDLDSAIEAMCRALKPSGVLVATLPGVTTAQGRDENDFWRFTELSARRLLGQNFPEHSIHVQGFGNVLAGIAGLHGVPADEFSECELQTPGEQHPVVIGIFARKE